MRSGLGLGGPASEIVRRASSKKTANASKKMGASRVAKARLALARSEENYTKIAGQAVELTDGSIVEGSLKGHGLQPDYVIDLKHPALASFLGRVHTLRYQPMAFWDKVDAVMSIVRATLEDKATNGDAYLKLLASHRDAHTTVSLGEYIEAKAGVCREHAMLLHVALQQVGIKTKYAYVHSVHGRFATDHAIVTLSHGGEVWVLDCYFPNFNGGRLKDFLKPGGDKPGDPRLPFASHPAGGHTLTILPYPIYWTPKRHAEWARTSSI